MNEAEVLAVILFAAATVLSLWLCAYMIWGSSNGR